MTMLFDQETATRNYVDRVRREAAERSFARGNVQGFVNACRDFGVSRNEALARVAKRFNLTAEDARSEVERCWEARGVASVE